MRVMRSHFYTYFCNYTVPFETHEKMYLSIKVTLMQISVVAGIWRRDVESTVDISNLYLDSNSFCFISKSGPWHSQSWSLWQSIALY